MIRCTILKRPSAKIKSPYVADIQLEDGTIALLHTPGLGCCGLVETGRIVYAVPSGRESKTDYSARIAECTDSDGVHYVGIHPFVSQEAARDVLPILGTNIRWVSEVVVEDGTRLDFVGTRIDGKKIYVEVKTAMVSMECEKERRLRRATFPEGYKKRKGDPVSPRAIKHCNILAKLCEQEDTADCYLIFMIPRNDCGDGMIVNEKDPYAGAVADAIRAGVKIRAFTMNYGVDGSVKVEREVPFYCDLSLTQKFIVPG